MSQTNFDDALREARRILIIFIPQLGIENLEAVVIRDYFGRLRVAFRGARENADSVVLDNLALTLRKSLSEVFSLAGSEFLFEEELVDPDSIFNSQDLITLEDSTSDNPTNIKLWLLDRQPIGLDWSRTPIKSLSGIPRATFFGIKGGVGRSTALVAFAWHLAAKGKKVLVIDLDLESPGLSSSLLESNVRPDFGVVDWFAANALGQDNEDFLQDMIAASPLDRVPQSLPGRIRVIPAFGSKTGDYIPKLSRSYLPTVTSDGTMDFAARLALMLERLEKLEQPDIVLLDSRAGIHDIAAIAITRLQAMAFLFGVNTSQTWDGYQLLFGHWRQQPQRLESFRDYLRIVSGLTPDPSISPAYLKTFAERSYDLFSNNIYEQDRIDENSPIDLSAFNFDMSDDQAPHTPLVIRWDDALRAFDPIRFPDHLEKTLYEKVFGHFVKEAERLCGLE
jgi:hypothetical protein